MADVTPNFNLPFPEDSDPSTVPSDIEALAAATDGALVGLAAATSSFAGLWTDPDGSPTLPTGMQLVYTSSGTLDPTTLPDGVRLLLAFIRGAGGGGAGAATTSAGQASVGGGGGQGGLGVVVYRVSSLPASVTVTVGSGGAGGTAAAGSTGGNSSVSGSGLITRTANGGFGGGHSTAGSNVHGVGGGGGVTGTSMWGIAGASGTNGIVSSGILGSIGHGGGGVHPATSVAGADGRTATAVAERGFGGSGAFNYASQGTARTGGAGADGFVRFWLLG